MRWTPGYRIIRTIYPPIDLFEDIADPADWELLVSAEAKLNPRIRDEVGNHGAGTHRPSYKWRHGLNRDGNLHPCID